MFCRPGPWSQDRSARTPPRSTPRDLRHHMWVFVIVCRIRGIDFCRPGLAARQVQKPPQHTARPTGLQLGLYFCWGWGLAVACRSSTEATGLQSSGHSFALTRAVTVVCRGSAPKGAGGHGAARAARWSVGVRRFSRSRRSRSRSRTIWPGHSVSEPSL